MYTQEQIQDKLKSFQGWGYVNGMIQKTYSFVDFMKSVEFLNQLSVVAESEHHHPDVMIKYSKVTISYMTHDEDGVTDKDFNMATKTDQIAINFI